MQHKIPKNISAPPLAMEDMYILDQCALIETKCAEVYRRFAELHNHIPELAKIWMKTALEEDHHALQFQMLGRMKGEGLTRLNADATKVNEALQNLKWLFEKLQAATISPAEALRLAIKLEDYLSQYHANSIAMSLDPEFSQLLNAMMNIDQDHVARLQKELDRLEGP